jgi:putative endonuclease
MTLLEKNFSIRGGEIDLILRSGAYIVFVEVKTRSGAYAGLGREAVTREKQRRVCRAAMRYIVEKGLADAFVRFDVVEIQGARVTHIPNAFSYVE